MSKQNPNRSSRPRGRPSRDTQRATANALETYRCEIPKFISDPVYTVVQRYYVKDASSDVVTVTKELPIPPWAFASSTTLLHMPFKAIRLSKMECWCVYRNSVGISGNTINVTVVERRGVRPIEWSDTASYQSNAHISKKFRPDETLGWYYGTTISETNPELSFRLPKGAVLELTFAYILDDADDVLSAGTSGLTANKIYTNNLSTDLEPIGKTYSTLLVY